MHWSVTRLLKPGQLRAALLLAALWLSPMAGLAQTLKASEFRIRDPFIHPDPRSRTYYLYAQSGNRKNSGYRGVEVYSSKDLVNWSGPQPVLSLPKQSNVVMVWAPEVHAYRGHYYLLVTLTTRDAPQSKPPAGANRPQPLQRGVYVFRATSPLGPFRSVSSGPVTPEAWMSLDGTLFVENGSPTMVFAHEWIQVINGTINVLRLKPDLSAPVGKPQLLFKASAAPTSKPNLKHDKVTDAPFLYRSPKSGKLFMTWSTLTPHGGYVVILAESKSGRINGPWIQQRVIHQEDGGHAMIFRTFDGRLLLALHKPNHGTERLRLYNLEDNGDTLTITSPLPGTP